jgi:nicotinamide phosphoribosyltransferase
MFNAQEYFSPKATDIEYTQTQKFVISLILMMDSYKFAHPFAYPDGIQGMTSYGEARIPESKTIVPFGWQILAKRYLTQRITKADIDIAEEFAIKHFGRKLFARESWNKVVNSYNGFLPLIIRIIPEGTVIHGGQPLYTVTVLDEDVFWMSAAFETMIQRAIWYPTTVATMDYEIKKKITKYYKQTGSDLNLIPFSYHDFGGRGVTCSEQAQIGGAAHLVNFQGSDTIEGIFAANFFYDIDMAGFSVYATEHAVECSFGGSIEGAKAYISKQLSNGVAGSIMSIVIDGYNVYREAELLCTYFKDQIIASGVKVVFRPDSGDMMEVVPRLLAMQEEAFGYELTSTGHKRIKYVGLIQGDGVDHDKICELLELIISLGYSADCIVFGSGGALLQKVNRDDLKFAQKACSILVNGKWIGIAKNPITDQGKKSKEGILTVGRNIITNEIKTLRLDTGEMTNDYVDMMVLGYHLGKLYNETNMETVRELVNS